MTQLILVYTSKFLSKEVLVAFLFLCLSVSKGRLCFYGELDANVCVPLNRAVILRYIELFTVNAHFGEEVGWK